MGSFCCGQLEELASQHVAARCQERSGKPRFKFSVILIESPKYRATSQQLLFARIGIYRMNTITRIPTRQLKRAFTLIEILIVVVILGILAAVVVPQFTNAADDANEAAVRTQLQTLRGQIELYRAQQNSDPDLLHNGWSDLMDNNYIMFEPTNSFNSSATIAATAATDVGWVWRDQSATNTTKALFAVDSEGHEFVE